MSEDAFWSGQLVEESDQPWQWYDPNRYDEKRKVEHIVYRTAAITAFKNLPKVFTEATALTSPAAMKLSAEDVMHFLALVRKALKPSVAMSEEAREKRRANNRRYYHANNEKMRAYQKTKRAVYPKRPYSMLTEEQRQRQRDYQLSKYHARTEEQCEERRVRDRAQSRIRKAAMTELQLADRRSRNTAQKRLARQKNKPSREELDRKNMAEALARKAKRLAMSEAEVLAQRARWREEYKRRRK